VTWLATICRLSRKNVPALLLSLIRCNDDTTEPTRPHLLSFVFTTWSFSSSIKVEQTNKYGDCRKYLFSSVSLHRERSIKLTLLGQLYFAPSTQGLAQGRGVCELLGKLALGSRGGCGMATFLLAVNSDQSLRWLLSNFKSYIFSVRSQHLHTKGPEHLRDKVAKWNFWLQIWRKALLTRHLVRSHELRMHKSLSWLEVRRRSCVLIHLSHVGSDISCVSDRRRVSQKEMEKKWK
jgi:hypothetical protein